MGMENDRTIKRRNTMAKRTVLASRAPDGHLQLLEPVELPTEEKFPVTLEVPEKRATAHSGRKVDLPTWPGKVIGRLTREEIYGDVG
jgi:hypothetical protein